MPNSAEQVLISDALQFIYERTGFDIEYLRFVRWLHRGNVKINDVEIEIVSTKLGGLWYITRDSLESIINKLNEREEREDV